MLSTVYLLTQKLVDSQIITLHVIKTVKQLTKRKN